MAGSARVFLSYSSKDADLVDRLKSALAEVGVVVWLDHEQLTAGTPNWQTKVREGIVQATYVVYAASETAALSPFVYDEINIARNKGKTVIPFWIRGTDWHDCAPLGFGASQYIDGRDAAYASGLAKLLATLGVASAVTATTTISRIPLYYRSCHTQIRHATHQCSVEVVASSLLYANEQFVYSREIARNHHQDHKRDEIAALDNVKKELEQNGWKCTSFDPDYTFCDGVWPRDNFKRR